MSRIGEMRGICEHNVPLLSRPCKECEEKQTWQERLSKKETVPFIEAISQRIIDTFSQDLNGIAGVYPVFVGTKGELGQGRIELELQRNWKDGYGKGPPAKLVVQVSIKSTQPWWRRAMNALHV